ncbi:hypothetical protein LOTGIDRAFT_172042 [Lottia gigantea]|uniref:L1 transposable element RRM domain-containing protein n=1 Tax=Lottia gigantea TaxID=225164 RepID=V4B4S6_LOTGI|nr:hypothetical protein LOTGIDRAFT_172042 [Lottia gigantea]ESP02481.1 hypothetical protein LOTGIDRAFT_172042 [Lottia gigantea]
MTLSLVFLVNLLMLMAGDIESNPGPATRQSQISTKTDLKDEIASLRGEVRELNIKDELMSLRNEVNQVKSDTDTVISKVDVNDNQLRQKYLIFYGFDESKEGKRETWGDCEISIRKFLSEKLKMEGAEGDSLVSIDRIHRVRKMRQNSSRSRPIKVSFHRLKMRDIILSKARQLLKESNVSVSEDFTQRVRSIRKGLIPHLKEAKQNSDNAVTLKSDKLIINRNVFTFDLEKKQLVPLNQ